MSLIQALPLIVGLGRPGACATCARAAPADGGVPRTERDLPLWLVVLGSLGLVARDRRHAT